MPDHPIIKPTTIKALLASGGSPEELIEAAYDLGVSHGMRYKTEAARESAAKKAKIAQDKKTARALAGLHKFKSNLEELWWKQLNKVFKLVEYEPKRFPCIVNGFKTTYAPDFRVTTEEGDMFWIEAKGEGWPLHSKKYKYRDAVIRQASVIQACVRTHKLHLFVVSGYPDEKYLTYQPLGFDVNNFNSKETLVRAKKRVIHLGRRPDPTSIADPTTEDIQSLPQQAETDAELAEQGFAVPPI